MDTKDITNAFIQKKEFDYNQLFADWDYYQRINAFEEYHQSQSTQMRDRIKELEAEITRLQVKYDENGYDCETLIKLKRMEGHIDASFKIWAERVDELENALNNKQKHTNLSEEKDLGSKLRGEW